MWVESGPGCLSLWTGEGNEANPTHTWEGGKCMADVQSVTPKSRAWWWAQRKCLLDSQLIVVRKRFLIPKIDLGWTGGIILASFIFKFTNGRIFDYLIKNFHLNTILKNHVGSVRWCGIQWHDNKFSRLSLFKVAPLFPLRHYVSLARYWVYRPQNLIRREFLRTLEHRAPPYANNTYATDAYRTAPPVYY